jgi:prepilin-type N-terminal cleavage/methylation domain-containing protein/prepilin-type processing-associated H-X9-DG protein
MSGTNHRRAFTLTELFVVIAVLGILVALLLPVLSRARAQSLSIACKNHLSQIGQAMTMYTSDYNIYPTAFGGPPFNTWADQLSAFSPVGWTNLSWHCPSFIANGGIVEWQPPPAGGGKFEASTSYSYNAYGMRGFQPAGMYGFSNGRPLGLGNLNLKVHDQQIVAPSEMYAVGDARPFHYQVTPGFVGHEVMNPWRSLMGMPLATSEGAPPHSQGYNLLFADTHVDLVKRRDYLYPPRTAHNWNRDNQPHPELWSPASDWAVQN